MLGRFIVTIILALGLTGYQPTDAKESGLPDHSSPAFARVRVTNSLRCGYVTYPTLFVKDQKTGVPSGMMVDFMNEVGRLAHVKIVWDHEVDWGLLQQEFDGQKIDAMCGSDWIQAHKLRQVFYSNPFAYDFVVALVRPDDHRFDAGIDRADAPDVTVCVIEGDGSDNIAKSRFSHARRFAVAPLESEQGCLLNVKTGKADVALVSNVSGGDYMKVNPGTLKLVSQGKPVTFFPVGIPVAHGDNDMVQLFNVAIM
jgi:ABC-type amino acid transport substrate-binding protein